MGTAAIQAAADESNGVHARNQRQPLNVVDQPPRLARESGGKARDKRITLLSDRLATVRGECAS